MVASCVFKAFSTLWTATRGDQEAGHGGDHGESHGVAMGLATVGGQGGGDGGDRGVATGVPRRGWLKRPGRPTTLGGVG